MVESPLTRLPLWPRLEEVAWFSVDPAAAGMFFFDLP